MWKYENEISVFSQVMYGKSSIFCIVPIQMECRYQLLLKLIYSFLGIPDVGFVSYCCLS